jgi:hypothetical protein
MSKVTRISDENIERIEALGDDINEVISMLLDRNSIVSDRFEMGGKVYQQRVSKGTRGWICELTVVGNASQ